MTASNRSVLYMATHTRSVAQRNTSHTGRVNTAPRAICWMRWVTLGLSAVLKQNVLTCWHRLRQRHNAVNTGRWVRSKEEHLHRFHNPIFITFQKTKIAKKRAYVPEVALYFLALLRLIIWWLVDGSCWRIQTNHYSLKRGELLVGSVARCLCSWWRVGGTMTATGWPTVGSSFDARKALSTPCLILNRNRGLFPRR